MLIGALPAGAVSNSGLQDMDEINEARASKDSAKIAAAEEKMEEFNGLMEQVGGWCAGNGWVVRRGT